MLGLNVPVAQQGAIQAGSITGSPAAMAPSQLQVWDPVALALGEYEQG